MFDQKKYTREYMKENYSQLSIRVKPEERAEVDDYCKNKLGGKIPLRKLVYACIMYCRDNDVNIGKYVTNS